MIKALFLVLLIKIQRQLQKKKVVYDTRNVSQKKFRKKKSNNVDVNLNR